MSEQILQVFHGILLVLLLLKVCLAQTTNSIAAIAAISDKQPFEAHYVPQCFFICCVLFLNKHQKL